MFWNLCFTILELYPQKSEQTVKWYLEKVFNQKKKKIKFNLQKFLKKKKKKKKKHLINLSTFAKMLSQSKQFIN
jgi:16S rRNA A1518/A1519 N6-dimethyltransferase RsmA/KsgA/DIM1 with predicted DNA glycosylase/AP lyase activity